MKNLKSIALTIIASIVVMSSGFANKNSTAQIEYESNQMYSRINQEMSEIALTNAKSKKGIVLLHLIINADGTIAVTDSNYSDEEIYKTIKKKLEAICLADSFELSGQEFNYSFKFNIID